VGTWTEQLLNSTDPKARRTACQKLAATRDPAVIPFLRKAYLEDGDKSVRDAARDASYFKAVGEGKRMGRMLPVNERALRILLGALAILFVISLLLNGLQIISSRDNKDNSKKHAIVGDPTDQNALVKRIQDQLGQARALSASLRR
jgi:hypothetical protein